LTPLFSVGVKEYCLTPTFNVYQSMFLPRLGHYNAPSTPFTPSLIAHIKLS